MRKTSSFSPSSGGGGGGSPDGESLRSRNARRIDSFGGGGSSTGTAADLEDIPFATAVSMDDYEGGGFGGGGGGGKGQQKGGKGGKAGGGGGLRTAPSSSADNTPPEAPIIETPSGKQAREWPAGLVDAVIRTFNRGPTEGPARALLSSQSWPGGMQETFFRCCKKMPIRFFIVDDSGSMSTNDGKKIVRAGPGKAKMVSCTRWSELTDALHFLVDLAEAAQAPSEIRLLNGADPVLVGMGDDRGEGLAFAREVLAESPAGQTPLCSHIACVVKAIKAMEKQLRANGQKAAVIIATDGESTDGSVAEAMKPLQKLPVWVVIRLATDAPEVVRYWDEIDKELELEMDVLDDLTQDARQVQKNNPWLRYGDEFHRMREFGASFKEMDLVDGECVCLGVCVCGVLQNFPPQQHLTSSLRLYPPPPPPPPLHRDAPGRRANEVAPAAGAGLPAAAPRNRLSRLYRHRASGAGEGAQDFRPAAQQLRALGRRGRARARVQLLARLLRLRHLVRRWRGVVGGSDYRRQFCCC